MEETTVACWERLSLTALSGFGTAPTAFQHPMRCIVSGFFVRCKNFFRPGASHHFALHFRRITPGRCPQTRMQQCPSKMKGYCRRGKPLADLP